MKKLDVSTPKYPNTFALVDDDDFERLSNHKWSAGPRHVYRRARDSRGSRIVLLHREIMCPPDGLVVDHIDGDPLNNQRSNLRVCTSQQNSFNVRPGAGVSRFKGVSKHRFTDKWRAYISFNREQVHLGFFDSEEAAAVAHDMAASILHGEYARLNYPNFLGLPEGALEAACRASSRMFAKGVIYLTEEAA